MKTTLPKLFFGFSGISVCLAIIKLSMKLSLFSPAVPANQVAPSVSELTPIFTPEASAAVVGCNTLTCDENGCDDGQPADGVMMENDCSTCSQPNPGMIGCALVVVDFSTSFAAGGNCGTAMFTTQENEVYDVYYGDYSAAPCPNGGPGAGTGDAWLDKDNPAMIDLATMGGMDVRQRLPSVPMLPDDATSW